MGKQSIFGGYTLTTEEFNRLISLAKQAVNRDKKTAEYKRQIKEYENEIEHLKTKIEALQRGKETIPSQSNVYRRNYDELYAEVKPFLGGIRDYPKLLLDVIQNRQKYKAKESER
jgi:predicted RNase H-like nuclease (RuvC/YqgF family)